MTASGMITSGISRDLRAEPTDNSDSAGGTIILGSDPQLTGDDGAALISDGGAHLLPRVDAIGDGGSSITAVAEIDGDSDAVSAGGTGIASLPLTEQADFGGGSDATVDGASRSSTDAVTLPAVTDVGGAVLVNGPITNDTVGSSGATPAQVRAALDDTGLSVTGAGVSVGVLSDSFNNLGGAAADEADGALPAASQINIVKDLSSGGSDEGRAMMQIIHDVAPGANLDFYTADESETDFADGILALAAAGCKVIVDDVTYFDEPFFQTDAVANAIQTVEAEGVTVLTSAGNEADAAFQSTWTPITSVKYDGHKLTDTLNFGSNSPVQTVTVGAGANPNPAPLILQWNQPWGSATADLALVVFSGNRYLGTFSDTSSGEPGSGYPYVQVDLSPGTYQIAIENLSGTSTDPSLVKDLIYGDTDPGTVSMSDQNSGTVIGHHMSPDAITVGAVNAADTPGFGVDPPVTEDFSSSGTGTELWFNYDGSEVSGAPESLAPVAVSGIDNINTTVSDLTDFYGTSAAVASVAGVAALMLQANPDLTPTQTKDILEESAVPMADPSVSGAGLVQAGVAVADAEAACFCRGTPIRTECGEITVEDLSIGDRVMTLSGEVKPVRWIGKRVIATRFADPLRALPIRICAEALGDGVPHIDLRLSPDHALLVDGVLIQAGALVNGGSILRETDVPETIAYYHIELAQHDIVFAAGSPAETFVDNAGRMRFDNWAEHLTLYDEASAVAELDLPRAKAQRQVPAATRARLAARAALWCRLDTAA